MPVTAAAASAAAAAAAATVTISEGRFGKCQRYVQALTFVWWAVQTSGRDE